MPARAADMNKLSSDIIKKPMKDELERKNLKVSNCFMKLSTFVNPAIVFV